MAKPGMTLAFVGSKGSGKTFAAARLCRLLGGFEEASLTECKDLAKELGNPQGDSAWMLDRSVAARERSGTVEPALVTFESSALRYTAVDTRGHPLLKGSLASLSLADVAVLVISAVVGEYEDDIASGRVRDTALACFNMGVKNMVCLVAKMDDPSVDFDSARFEDIKEVVGGIVKEAGYKQKEPPFVPVSSLSDGNFTAKSPEMVWYGGTTVIENLDALGAPNRSADKPLRLPVFKVHEMPGGGTVIVGRVETGSIRNGIKVLFSPSGQTAEVKSLCYPGGSEISSASSGDIVTASIDGDNLDIRPGMVAGSAGSTEDPAADADWFQAQIKVLDHPGTIRAGYCPGIAVGTAQVPCEFEELLTKLDPKTGKEAESNPQGAKPNEVIMAKMRPRAPVCMEAFSAYPVLGRFTVRDHGKTVAVGVVKKVEKRPIPTSRSGNENRYFET